MLALLSKLLPFLSDYMSVSCLQRMVFNSRHTEKQCWFENANYLAYSVLLLFFYSNVPSGLRRQNSTQGSANFLHKGADSKYFKFCGPENLCSNYLLCFSDSKTAVDSIEMNGHGYVPIKLFKKTGDRCTWLMDCSVLNPCVYNKKLLT